MRLKTLPAVFGILAAAAVFAANPPANKAVAKIEPSEVAASQPTQQNIAGTVTFTEENGKVSFVADVEGFEANSVHGFHIHEKGDLSAPDLSSAGGHFNPSKESHGGPDAEHHHAGDLGNLKADENGKAHLSGTVAGVHLQGVNAIVDRSVIIHADEDDLKSQPAGSSGSRIAGGVIKAEK